MCVHVYVCVHEYAYAHAEVIGLPGVGSFLASCEIMSLTVAIVIGDNRLYPLNHWFVFRGWGLACISLAGLEFVKCQNSVVPLYPKCFLLKHISGWMW